MMGTNHTVAQLLWMGGLAATPLAIAVAALCRHKGVRPATRHMLWAAVLASFITPAIGSLLWRPHWFRSDRLTAAADLVFGRPESRTTLVPPVPPSPTAVPPHETSSSPRPSPSQPAAADPP